MSKPYSLDLRERVVEFVEAGASRHEAAECFVVSVSSAIRWMQRRMRFGSVAAKPSGGEHVAAGGACAVVAQADRRASGFDPG